MTRFVRSWLGVAATTATLALGAGQTYAQSKELVFGFQCDRTGPTATVVPARHIANQTAASEARNVVSAPASARSTGCGLHAIRFSGAVVSCIQQCYADLTSPSRECNLRGLT